MKATITTQNLQAFKANSFSSDKQEFNTVLEVEYSNDLTLRMNDSGFITMEKTSGEGQAASMLQWMWIFDGKDVNVNKYESKRLKLAQKRKKFFFDVTYQEGMESLKHFTSLLQAAI